MRTQRQAIVYGAWAVAILLGFAIGLAIQRLWALRHDVEQLAERLVLNRDAESTLVYDADNEVVSALFEEHRIAVSIDDISPHIVDAVIAVEDKRFWRHRGIDFRRVVMAAKTNIQRGHVVQGGSTITQQLVRSLVLNRERSYTRKFKEALLARRLEERYTKREILEAYLNRVYFGDGYYGIEAAALGYFGKRAADLNAVESATLAGLIKGPSHYSPTKAPERSRKRRDLVLEALRAEGKLSDQEFQAAVAVPVSTRSSREKSRLANLRHARGAEYFRELVARELSARFGAEAVYTGGLRVYTTLDRGLQTLAESVVLAEAQRLARWQTDGEALQGALVAIEPRTGFVKALVGGRDFHESSFNRAIDSKRQPGSAFKPFIYAAALESGFLPSTRLSGLDEPIDTREGPWLPNGKHEPSSLRVREALVMSSNRAAAHLLQQVGIRRTLDLVSRFGITTAMPAVPSVALGTGETSLLELTSAYTVFANRGQWRTPTTIRRVVDRFGREIYRAPGTERAVVSDATAYLMTSMLADVVDRGTATTARAAGLRVQAAGKTGTSADYSDAWFVGYTPQLVTGVWFGHDRPQPIMQRGYASVVAVPAWAKFMTAATRDTHEWFKMPGSLVKVRLCRISGLVATDRCHLPVAVDGADYSSAEALEIALTGFRDHAGRLLREGGTFEDLRTAHRMPEVCSLVHIDWDANALHHLHEASDVRPPD